MRADDRALAGAGNSKRPAELRLPRNISINMRAEDGRLLGRFHDDGVAGDERGGDHSAKNRDRKIPWRDDEGDAARPIMLIAFFAGNMLGQTRAADAAAFVARRRGRNRSLRGCRRRLRPTLCRLRKLPARKVRNRRRSMMAATRSSNCARSSTGDAAPMIECSCRAAATARSASGIPASAHGSRRLGPAMVGLIEAISVVGPDFLAVDHERIFLAERRAHISRARRASSSWLCCEQSSQRRIFVGVTGRRVARVGAIRSE